MVHGNAVRPSSYAPHRLSSRLLAGGACGMEVAASPQLDGTDRMPGPARDVTSFMQQDGQLITAETVPCGARAAASLTAGPGCAGAVAALGAAAATVLKCRTDPAWAGVQI